MTIAYKKQSDVLCVKDLQHTKMFPD